MQILLQLSIALIGGLLITRLGKKMTVPPDTA